MYFSVLATRIQVPFSGKIWEAFPVPFDMSEIVSCQKGPFRPLQYARDGILTSYSVHLKHYKGQNLYDG